MYLLIFSPFFYLFTIKLNYNYIILVIKVLGENKKICYFEKINKNLQKNCF